MRKKKDPSKMTQKYKKVQTIKTIVLKIKRTYFIPVDEADVDCLYYEPTDEEVISRDVEEEII